MSRRAPRPFSFAIEDLRERIAPPGGLAAAQQAWRSVAGDAIADAATPVALREGVLTVECESAVWAQELQLIGPDLAARLGEQIGDPDLQAVRAVTGRRR